MRTASTSKASLMTANHFVRCPVNPAGRSVRTIDRPVPAGDGLRRLLACGADCLIVLLEDEGLDDILKIPVIGVDELLKTLFEQLATIPIGCEAHGSLWVIGAAYAF